MPKSWIEKDKETGDSKVNIPEGKKVRLRGVLNMDVDEDYLENAFKKQQREKSKNDVEKRLKDEAYDYFDEKKENSDEWFDVDEEVDRVVDEWKEERDSTFWKVRNEFLEKENNLGYDESIRKAEEKGEEAAVKIDEKHLSRLREMASKYREGK